MFFLLSDWDNKGVVLRCFEAIATILLNCATRPSLSRQKWLSFFKVVKRCPCRAVQLHEGRVCRRKAVKTPSRPFKLLPVGFVILLAIFFGGKALQSSWFELFLKFRDVLAAAWGGGGVQAQGCSRGGLEIGGLVTARPASCKLAPPPPFKRFPWCGISKETRWEQCCGCWHIGSDVFLEI